MILVLVVYRSLKLRNNYNDKVYFQANNMKIKTIETSSNAREETSFFSINREQ